MGTSGIAEGEQEGADVAGLAGCMLGCLGDLALNGEGL